MKISVLLRQMVNPSAHEVLREEHGHVVLINPFKCLVEDLEAPIFSLLRRS